jgi:hypothetical protein
VPWKKRQRRKTRDISGLLFKRVLENMLGAGIVYGFNIIGEHGRPLVAFSYERREEAASPGVLDV